MGHRTLPPGLDILPVDDRCVPLEHEFSNVGLFQAALGTYRARPLFDERRGIGGSVTALREAIGFGQDCPRFTILGLGPDGHTASLFPGSADLPTGLDACAPAFIAAQPTLEPMVPRITMTAPFILAAWDASGRAPEAYAAGTMGPAKADLMLGLGGHRWHEEARA